MKKQKTILSLALIAVFVFLLSGCKAKSVSAYTLPLGDSGYISEIDFRTKNSYVYSYTSDGIANEWVSYKYAEQGKEYTVNIEFGKNEVDGKVVVLEAGYYEGSEFKVYEKTDYIVLSSENFVNASLTFTPTTDETIVKLIFGTNLDEAYAKENNPGIKNGDLKKIVKQFRGKGTIIRTLTINETGDSTLNNILSQPITDAQGNLTTSRVAVQSTDLTYYNTALITYDVATDSVLLTLNYKGGPWQWIVNGIGIALNWITQLVGGYYWLGILILTFIIRTAAWPIYAKSTNMTSRMSEIQPELDKINKKYEGKNDQNSMMKKQLETKEVMKKNHVSMFGCFLPLLQMPIFLWVYQVVQRFPITPLYDATNYKFLWTTFSADYGVVTGDWILALLVGLTMIASQELSTFMTKRINAKKANFYTKQQSKQNNMQQRIMMIVMTVMMIYFAWRSAGIAFYWIVGNLYQILQTFISKKQEEKRAEKLRLESGKPRGRS